MGRCLLAVLDTQEAELLAAADAVGPAHDDLSAARFNYDRARARSAPPSHDGHGARPAGRRQLTRAAAGLDQMCGRDRGRDSMHAPAPSSCLGVAPSRLLK